MDKRIFRPYEDSSKIYSTLNSKTSINSKIYEAFSETKINQQLTNTANKSLEIQIDLPLTKDIVIKSFEAKLGEKTFKSKIMEKFKADEKYSDSLSSGNVGVLGTYTEVQEKSDYSMKIGNLNPKETITIETSILQQISSQDLSYRYSFTYSNFPKILVNEVSSTEQKSLIAVTNFNFKAEINSKSSLTRLISPSHKFAYGDFDDAKLKVEVTIQDTYKLKEACKDIIILFRNMATPIPKIYEEYNSKLKNYTYNFNCRLDERNNMGFSESVDTEQVKFIIITKRKNKCMIVQECLFS